MKAKYLDNFKDKTKDELVHIISDSKKYNEYAVAAAHELLRKKTTTFSEYQEITGGKTNFPETTISDKKQINKSTSNINILDAFLNIIKWIGIILFFPLSLLFVGYYRNKKAKKEYYANNRPQSERNN